MDLKELINKGGNQNNNNNGNGWGQNNNQNGWGGNNNQGNNGSPWGGNQNNNNQGNPWGGNNNQNTSPWDNQNNNNNGNGWGTQNNNQGNNGSPWGGNQNNNNNSGNGWGGQDQNSQNGWGGNNNQNQKMQLDQNVMKEISERLRSMNSHMESAYTTLVSRNKTRTEVGDMVSSATYKNKLTVDYDNVNRSIVPMFSFRGDIGGSNGSTQNGFGGGFGGSNFTFNGSVASSSSNDATYGIGVAFKNIDDRFTDIVNILSKYDVGNLDLCEGYCCLSCFNGGSLILAPSTQLLNEKKSSL